MRRPCQVENLHQSRYRSTSLSVCLTRFLLRRHSQGVIVSPFTQSARYTSPCPSCWSVVCISLASRETSASWSGCFPSQNRLVSSSSFIHNARYASWSSLSCALSPSSGAPLPRYLGLRRPGVPVPSFRGPAGFRGLRGSALLSGACLFLLVFCIIFHFCSASVAHWRFFPGHQGG